MSFHTALNAASNLFHKTSSVSAMGFAAQVVFASRAVSWALTQALMFGLCMYKSAWMTLLNGFDIMSTVLFSRL